MHPLSRWVLLSVPLLVCGSLTSAHAIEPSRAIAQYIRERWGPDRGFPGEEVRAITQTSDGYLWIGTDRGLVRFDGLSFRLVSGSDAKSIEAVGVLGLAADADGGLWIRVQGRRLLRYRGGTFEDAIWPISPREMTVTTINSGNNGDVLFAGIVNGVLRFHAGGFAHLAAADLLRRSLVTAITEDRVGNIWLGTLDNGLLCLSAGQVTSFTKGLPAKRVNTVLPVGDHDVWIGTDRGVMRWNGSSMTNEGVPTMLRQVQVFALHADRAGNLWVGTKAGLIRVDAKGNTSRDEEGAGARRAVTAVFEDGEGDIWVGRNGSLERLRAGPFIALGRSHGLPSDQVGPVYVDKEKRTWAGPIRGGLYWLRDNASGKISVAGLDSDVVYSITGHDNELWIGRRRGGLTRLRTSSGGFDADSWTEKDGLAQNSVFTVNRNRDGTIWAGTHKRGVRRLRDGALTNIHTARRLRAK